MILNYLSSMWKTMAPAVGNHLWQSTVFLVMAALLTLLLRKNHARTRYWLWLAASLKFLVPFSLLVSMGSYFAQARGSAGAKPGLYVAMEGVGQPFTRPAMLAAARTAPSTISLSLMHALPAILTAVWFCGFLTVIFIWCVRWRRISATVRNAIALTEGREVEALRRLSRSEGKHKKIEIIMSQTSLEPGIFGIVRPVLVWPEGISGRLEDAHLEAILVHELRHVERRDNLAAVMHMMVEAIFWFHPLVWWLGARLVGERERACDEAVLASGSARQVYAESILKICEFCVGSPLNCVSGVTGSDLKKRISRIMSHGVVRQLDFGRKLLLGAAGLMAVAVPVAFGLLHATRGSAEPRSENASFKSPLLDVKKLGTSAADQLGVALRQKETQGQDSNALSPVYEFASVRVNRSGDPTRSIIEKNGALHIVNFTLHRLIRAAYGVQDSQITDGPSFFDSEGYDIEAKIGSARTDELHKLSADQSKLQMMRILQSLLADRFRLALHSETREVPVYVLMIDRGGPKFHAAIPGDTYPNGVAGLGGRPVGGPSLSQPEAGKLVSQGCDLSCLIRALSGQNLVDRAIVDKTGLVGNYDFTLQWVADEGQSSLFRAIQEQLGLKLEPQESSVKMLVIDHAEQPSEN